MGTRPWPSILLAPLRYLRLKSFGFETEEQRSAERYRRAALGSAATIVSRATAMLQMVLTFHWAAPMLGHERFGIWATFASLVAMLSFLDLGVGNALINRVAHAKANNDSSEMISVIVGGISWLVVVGVTAICLLTFVAWFVPWQRLFKLVDVASSGEAKSAAMVFGVLFGFNLVASGLLRVLVGLQRSYEAQLIATAGSIFASVAIWVAIHWKASVGTLLCAGFGVQCAITIIFGLPMLRTKGHMSLKFIASNMRIQRAILFRTGSLFLALQIGTMIGWGSDAFMVATIGGASAVAIFAVAQRLFQFASQPVAVVNGSLWAAYADANIRSDRRFIQITVIRSLRFSLAIAGSMAVLLMLMGPSIIPYWTKNSINVPRSLLVAYAVWTIIEAAGAVLGTYLNGVGIVRQQVIVVFCFCLVALPLKIFAMTHYGPTGLMVATTVAYLLTVGGLYSTVFRNNIIAPMRHRPHGE